MKQGLGLSNKVSVLPNITIAWCRFGLSHGIGETHQ